MLDIFESKSNLVEKLRDLRERLNKIQEAEILRQASEAALKASEETFRMLVECCSAGIFLETVQGKILDCNQAGLKMFGYTKEEMVGLTIADLVPEDFAANLPEVISEADTTGDVAAERVNRRKDGSLFPTEITTKLLTVGGEPRLIAYVTDITDRKRLEGERERRIAELQKALNEAKTCPGLIPICASCKKIRDGEKGGWRQVEEYIQDHFEVQFSHGICPDCVARLYPELGLSQK